MASIVVISIIMQEHFNGNTTSKIVTEVVDFRLAKPRTKLAGLFHSVRMRSIKPDGRRGPTFNRDRNGQKRSLMGQADLVEIEVIGDYSVKVYSSNVFIKRGNFLPDGVTNLGFRHWDAKKITLVVWAIFVVIEAAIPLKIYRIGKLAHKIRFIAVMQHLEVTAITQKDVKVCVKRDGADCEETSMRESKTSGKGVKLTAVTNVKNLALLERVIGVSDFINDVSPIKIFRADLSVLEDVERRGETENSELGRIIIVSQITPRG